MVSIRTIARALLLLALFGVAAGSAAAIPVDPGLRPPVPKPPKPKHARQIVFPVLGTVDFSDDYGAPRPQGPHEGIDILAPRHALALAAEAGRVRFYTGSGRAGCMLYLDGKSGTTYYYIHLNNDLTNGNDNRGGCKVGSLVRERPEDRRARSRPGSRSGTSATRATRTGSIRTSTSRCIRTAAGRRTRTSACWPPEGCSSTWRPARRSRCRCRRPWSRRPASRCGCA